MKKSSFLTIGLIVISIGVLNAQTNQGNFLLDLSSDIFGSGYMTIKTKSDAGGSDVDSKVFYVSLSSNAGYFLIDNLAVGLDISLGLNVSDIGSGNSNASWPVSAGPFIRYYVPTSKVLPFFELGGSIGSQGSNTTWGYGGGIGMAVPLSERIMFDVLAGYQSTAFKQREDNSDNTRIIIGRLGLGVGFVIFLSSN